MAHSPGTVDSGKQDRIVPAGATGADAPKFLETLINQAERAGASDIHLQTGQGGA